MPRRPILHLAALFLPLVLAFSGAGAAPLRESFEMTVAKAPAPVLVEGRPRLVFELHLTNFSTDVLGVAAVRVLDGETGAVRRRLDGAELAGAFRLLRPTPRDGGKAAPPALAPGDRALVYLEVDADPGSVPRWLDHEVDYTVAAGPERFTVRGGRTAVESAAPPVLGPPLRGGPWVAVHHPIWPRGHRRMLYATDGRARIPGRFAVDWVRVDERGRTANGDEDRTAAALGYDADVLAVADAAVAAVRDDIAESPRVSANPPHVLADAAGNFVALDLGGGRYAVYEHLRPGSLRVKAGDRVRRGQVIAALGFTGDSTGPHLHLHAADSPAPLGGEGIPWTLDQFELLGGYRDVSALGNARWQPVRDGLTARRTGEFPSANAVLNFPP